MVTPKVELLQNLGALQTWDDVTSDVRGEARIRQGISPERNIADPASCSLTLDNTNGDYTNLAPRTNAQLRVRLDGSTVTRPTVRNDQHAAGTATTLSVTTPTNSEGDILLVMHAWGGAEADGTFTPAIDGERWELLEHIDDQGMYTLFGSDPHPQAALWWKVVGAETEPSTITVGQPGTYYGKLYAVSIQNVAPYRPLTRARIDSDTPFPIATPYGLSLYFGAAWQSGATAHTLRADTSDWDATGRTYNEEASVAAGGADRPTIAVVSADNSSEVNDYELDVGDFETLVGAVPTSGVGVYSFSVSLFAEPDPNHRFIGEVAEWPMEWQAAGADVTIPIVANGLSRRLSRDETQSCVRRSILGRDVYERDNRNGSPSTAQTYRRLGYWPLESDFSSAIGGVEPALPGAGAAYTFGEELSPGSSGGMNVTAAEDVTFTAYQNTSVDITAGTHRMYGWEFAFRFTDDTPNGQPIVVDIPGGNLSTRITVDVAASTFDVEVLTVDNADGSTTSVHNETGLARTTDDYHYVRFEWITNVTAEDIGTTDHYLAIDGAPIDRGTLASGTDVLAPSGLPISVYAENVVIGHLYADYDRRADRTPWQYLDSWTAHQGHPGESGAARIFRAFREFGLLPEVYGDLHLNTRLRLGAQQPNGILDVAREAVDLDAGLLTESTDRLTFRYRTRTGLYSSTNVDVSYTDSTIQNQGLGVTEDDQATVNKATVRNGASDGAATVEDSTSSKGTSAPPDGVGVYSSSRTVYAQTDVALDPLANWLVYLGTQEGYRYRDIRFDLRHVRESKGKTALADNLEAVVFGDTITITDLPSFLPPGDVLLFVDGITETLSTTRHVITFTTRHGEPYVPAIVGDGTSGTIDVRGQRVDGEYTEVGAGLYAAASGAYAYAPDAAGLDVTGDISLYFNGQLADWHSGTQTLLAKWEPSGDQRSYALRVTSTGLLQIAWSTDGTAGGVTTVNSTEALPQYGKFWVRAFLDTDNGAAGNDVYFYYSTESHLEGVDVTGDWDQLGTTVTTGGTTSIYAGTARLTIMGETDAGTTNPATGVAYVSSIRDALSSVALANYYTQTAGASSFTGSDGYTYTIAGSAALYQGVDSDDTTMLAITAPPPTTTDLIHATGWTTDSDDMNTGLNGGGLFVSVGSEVMRVSAITNTNSPQLFTIVRAQEGTTAASRTRGLDINVTHPARAGL